MGQCCGKCLSLRRRRRQYRHKRFEYAPKRSWKYKDATLLNEFHEMSLQANSESAGLKANEVDPGTAGIPHPVANDNREETGSDEEVEVDSGEIRMSGRLVFSEEEFDSDFEDELLPADVATHLNVAMVAEEEMRTRSSSAGSEQIGRFEVMDVEESEEAASKPLMSSSEGNGTSSGSSSANSNKESSKLITHVHQANAT